MADSREKIIIGNCSGFYGDRLSAARDMVDGGPIDVLTGDYLAELTMTILYNQKMKRGDDQGYVGTFLKQFKDVAVSCQEKNIKIVTNAGGLNPSSMAEKIEEIIQELNLNLKVAYIDGDDLIPRIEELKEADEPLANIEKGNSLHDYSKKPLTANAYFGAWGIKEALDAGADVVVCPRVTDAAVVIGPAAWKYNWSRDNYDALAGALAAGHIIECGAQATGGNYSFFHEVPSFFNIGYPIAEIYEDGSFTITKHPGTGGLVSVGTVTAQLLYEIGSPAYINPDVIGHFDTLKMEQEADDRVFVSGCRGSSAPKTHKVCVNLAGGFRNGTEILLTGIDIEVNNSRFFSKVTRDNDNIVVHGPWGDALFKILPRFTLPGSEAQAGGLIAPMPGKVVDLKVKTGSKVKKGDTLVILEAMKMEHQVKAPEDGKITKVLIKKDDQLENGALLMVLDN
jgi:hypothetical protein